MSFFVVVFSGRTGTSVTISALNQHPLVEFSGEVIGPHAPGGMAAQRNALREVAESTTTPVGGLKTKFHELVDPEDFADAIDELGATVIHSRRTNILKQAVSAVRIKARAELMTQELDVKAGEAALTGNRAWNVMSGDPALTAVALDPAAVRHEFQWISEQEHVITEWLDRRYPRRETWAYEDLISNQPEYFAGVFHSVGLEAPPSLELGFSKHTPDDLAAAVPNLDEVLAAIPEAADFT